MTQLIKKNHKLIDVISVSVFLFCLTTSILLYILSIFNIKEYMIVIMSFIISALLSKCFTKNFNSFSLLAFNSFKSSLLTFGSNIGIIEYGSIITNDKSSFSTDCRYIISSSGLVRMLLFWHGNDMANGNSLNIKVTKPGKPESNLSGAHLPERHTWKKGDHTSSVRVYLSAYGPKRFFCFETMTG